MFPFVSMQLKNRIRETTLFPNSCKFLVEISILDQSNSDEYSELL